MNRQKLDDCVEKICNKGCREVNRLIARMEQGDSVREVEDMSIRERCAVLSELKAIMAVYGARCSVNEDDSPMATESRGPGFSRKKSSLG